MLFHSCCGSNGTFRSSCGNCCHKPQFCILFRRSNGCCQSNERRNRDCSHGCKNMHEEKEREENCCNPCCR